MSENRFSKDEPLIWILFTDNNRPMTLDALGLNRQT